MPFIDFLSSLPFGEFSGILAGLVAFLVLFGIYKFVKEWLPW